MLAHGTVTRAGNGQLWNWVRFPASFYLIGIGGSCTFPKRPVHGSNLSSPSNTEIKN